MCQTRGREEKREILPLGIEREKKGWENWMEKQLGHDSESGGSTGSALGGVTPARSTSPTKEKLSGASSDE